MVLGNLVGRMTDVELLGELRRITHRARLCHDDAVVVQASALQQTFYEYRVRGAVPAPVWEAMRAFVREHAV